MVLKGVEKHVESTERATTRTRSDELYKFPTSPFPISSDALCYSTLYIGLPALLHLIELIFKLNAKQLESDLSL